MFGPFHIHFARGAKSAHTFAVATALTSRRSELVIVRNAITFAPIDNRSCRTGV